MTLTLELTPEETRRVEEARARGLDVETLLHGVLAALPSAEATTSAADSTAAATRALFAQWEAEDATDDPEELARRQAEWEEFKANMNANRAATGERIPFP